MKEKRIIPLHLYRTIIPEPNYKKYDPKKDNSKEPDLQGVRFEKIYKHFVENKFEGARNKPKVRRDLFYYIELGFFGRIHNETYKQPIFYQTHIGGDLVTDTGLQNGVKFVKSKLDEHFKNIETEWKKLDKEKLFLKNKKTKRGELFFQIPSKKFDRWIMLFDYVIDITENLMWTRETMDYYTLNEDYTKLIKYSIKELNKFAKKVHSTSKGNEQSVIAIFARFPFRITF